MGDDGVSGKKLPLSGRLLDETLKTLQVPITIVLEPYNTDYDDQNDHDGDNDAPGLNGHSGTLQRCTTLMMMIKIYHNGDHYASGLHSNSGTLQRSAIHSHNP